MTMTAGDTLMATSDGGLFRVIWSDEDGAYVGLCDGYSSLSWVAATLDEALAGIRWLVAEVILDLQCRLEDAPKRDAGE